MKCQETIEKTVVSYMLTVDFKWKDGWKIMEHSTSSIDILFRFSINDLDNTFLQNGQTNYIKLLFTHKKKNKKTT
ncbi:hypothetical protein EUGRSUZ_F00194 [Eucalyptus grandis]|uniref:Uncharacterized protein n=2 Tax=Eucalyptus grandis TaxID=71139 RepID=A0ACC3KAD8_EUCGR|nr:hypothetical protein EUGRSUZ_F00194 [Eucalyptus grandis]